MSQEKNDNTPISIQICAHNTEWICCCSRPRSAFHFSPQTLHKITCCTSTNMTFFASLVHFLTLMFLLSSSVHSRPIRGSKRSHVDESSRRHLKMKKPDSPADSLESLSPSQELTETFEPSSSPIKDPETQALTNKPKDEPPHDPLLLEDLGETLEPSSSPSSAESLSGMPSSLADAGFDSAMPSLEPPKPKKSKGDAALRPGDWF